MTGPAFVNNRFLPRAQPTSGGAVPGGDSLVAVADIAALQALDDTAVDDGGVVSVKSVLDLWMLDKTSVLATDGITIVATNSGTGRWVRLKVPNLTWQLQATWYIDEITGGDENNGATPLSALASWGEYQRRIGEGPLEVSHTVTFTSTLSQDIHVNTVSIDDSVTMTLQGVRSSPIYSGSVTAKQALNAGGNVDLQVTDAALPVSWTASGLVDRLYVLTSGANAGAAGWIAKDVGGKAARITKAYNEGAGTYVEPAIGDSFDVVDLGLVNGTLRGIEGGNVRVKIRDLRFDQSGGAAFETEGGNWQASYCDIEGQTINLSGSSQQSSRAAAAVFYACRLQSTSFTLLERATVNLNASLLASGVTSRTHGTLAINQDSVFQYEGVGSRFIRAGGGSRFIINSNASLGVFDLPNPGDRAVNTVWNGVAVLRGFLYGYGNTFDYAIEAGSGSNIIYASGFKPVVTTGALRDALVGNLARPYLALPVANMNRMCGIVVE